MRSDLCQHFLSGALFTRSARTCTGGWGRVGWYAFRGHANSKRASTGSALLQRFHIIDARARKTLSLGKLGLLTEDVKRGRAGLQVMRPR